MRLAVSLPSAWEGRDLEVVRAPFEACRHRDDKGARFLFDVESVAAPIAHFPRTIQLSWIAEGPPPPLLEPGARWRLTVRLKRPHGNANYGVRDAEAGLLARNVRATGYVSAPATARRLAGLRARRGCHASTAGAPRCVRASTRCWPTRRIVGSWWRSRSARRTKSARPTGC